MRLDVVLSFLLLVVVLALVGVGGVGVYKVGRALLDEAESAQPTPAPGDSTPIPQPAAAAIEAPTPAVPGPPPPAVAPVPADEPAPPVAAEPEPPAEPLASLETPPAPTAPAPPAPAILVEPSCQSQPMERLRLDALVTDPGLVQVYLDGFKASLPKGAKLPPRVKVQGVDVVVFHLPPGFDQPPRLCLDLDQAFAEKVAAQARRPKPNPFGDHVWMVPASVPGTTVVALLAPGLDEQFDTEGPLLAFAPTDNLVAFADSTNPLSVALAAKTVTARIETNSDDGCVTDVPLVRTKAGWVPWKVPPRHPAAAALKAYAAAAFECRLALTVAVVDITRDLVGDAGVVDYELPDLVPSEALPATDGTHRLITIEDEPGVQLLASADVIEFDFGEKALRFSMPWGVFAKVAGKRLKPLELAHKKVPRCWRLEPGLMATQFANVAGVQMRSVPPSGGP